MKRILHPVALIGAVVFIAVLALGGYVVHQLRIEFRAAHCHKNLVQVGLGLAIYTQDYDDTFPPSGRGAEVGLPYIWHRGVYNCPLVRPEPTWPASSYGFSSALSGMTVEDITRQDEYVMLFDAAPGFIHPGQPTVADPAVAFDPRHRSQGLVCYVSGRVMRVPSAAPGGHGSDSGDLVPSQ